MVGCKQKMLNQCQNSFSLAGHCEEPFYTFLRVSFFWIRVVWVEQWKCQCLTQDFTKYTKTLYKESYAEWSLGH